MATRPITRIVEHLRRVAHLHDETLTDGKLLGRYLEYRDESAFAAIVQRHGGMVWGVCRRLAVNHHDAEDAFQAAFLVLARKAASVSPRDMLASWLHGVARHTAMKARALAMRRRSRERQVKDMPEPAADHHDIWRDLQGVVDQELGRLPEKYRIAILLCDLEGKTRREASRQLGIPEGTLAAHLARGRNMLARRLVRQGIAVSGGALATLLTDQAAPACAPDAAVTATISAVSDAHVPAAVAFLVEGVMTSMLIARLKTVLVVLLTVALVTLSRTRMGTPVSMTAAAGAQAPAAPIIAAAGAQAPGLGRTGSAGGAEDRVVQLHFGAPMGMHVAVIGVVSEEGGPPIISDIPFLDRLFQNAGPDATPGNAARALAIDAPGRVSLPPGLHYAVKLSDIPNRPGLTRLARIELPRSTPATEAFLSVSAIPIEFTDDDFDQLDRGKAITKVIFLPTAAKDKKAAPGQGAPIAIASYTSPQEDVIEVARRQGSMLAVIRMGNRDPESAPAQGQVQPNKGDLVKIKIGNDGVLGRVARVQNTAGANELNDLKNQVQHFMLKMDEAKHLQTVLQQQLNNAELKIRSLQELLKKREDEIQRLRKAQEGSR
jgi:RNA polymerase sigma factor (sigma-70 family)